MYGDQSAYITNLVHGMSPSEHLETLSAFFQPYYSRLPHYVEEDPDCQPVAIVSTEWNSDELAGFGSYCNFQVGMTDADGDVEALRHGCPERRLWFAGEHVAPFDELGTATGAYLSGEGAAKSVVQAFGRICGSADLDGFATT
jgi:Flavin containing amine oxidoreductase